MRVSKTFLEGSSAIPHFFCGGGSTPQQVEVPGLGIKLQLQLPRQHHSHNNARSEPSPRPTPQLTVLLDP